MVQQSSHCIYYLITHLTQGLLKVSVKIQHYHATSFLKWCMTIWSSPFKISYSDDTVYSRMSLWHSYIHFVYYSQMCLESEYCKCVMYLCRRLPTLLSSLTAASCWGEAPFWGTHMCRWTAAQTPGCHRKSTLWRKREDGITN